MVHFLLKILHDLYYEKVINFDWIGNSVSREHSGNELSLLLEAVLLRLLKLRS